MWVSIIHHEQELQVLQLAQQAGKLVATERTVFVQPGQRLGEVPYEKLWSLGEGEHEVDLGSLGFSVTVVPEKPEGIGFYLFLACGCLVMAVVAYYWALDLQNAPPRRVRIHWLVALVYAVGEQTGLGGHWCLAGLFTFVGFCVLVVGFWRTRTSS